MFISRSPCVLGPDISAPYHPRLDSEGGKSMGKRTFLGAAVVVMALFGAACGRTETAGDGISGSIAVDGSSTVFPITQAIAEEFGAEQPGVRVSVGTSGTGGGFEKFCAGETDVSDASRPIDSEEEAPICAKNGVEYVELQVAIDGLSVVVNPENDFAS